MNPIPKYISVISGTVIFLFLGYFIFQENPTSQLDEDKNSLSQSENETNTKKYTSNSGSDKTWGSNPFEMGKSTTKIEEEQSKSEVNKVIFQKPNTEWKTRTLSGITYIFGQGNPKEVALNQKQIEDYIQSLGSKNDYGDYGYITPEIERLLFQALSDPSWIGFEECFDNSPVTFPTWNQTGNMSRVSIADIRRPGFLDIETFLMIDPVTGRKELYTNKLLPLLWFLRDEIHPPENIEGNEMQLSCKIKYGTKLHDILHVLHQQYAFQKKPS